MRARLLLIRGEAIIADHLMISPPNDEQIVLGRTVSPAMFGVAASPARDLEAALGEIDGAPAGTRAVTPATQPTPWLATILEPNAGSSRYGQYLQSGPSIS
jgi:hypothetical protein